MTHTRELNWKQSLCNVTGKESQNEVIVGDPSVLNPLTEEGQEQSAGTEQEFCAGWASPLPTELHHHP